jgi:hypothetical protein
LHHLEASVTEEELHEVIRSAPKEKAPRLDDFIDLFFSQCWSIIKAYLLQAVHHCLLLNQQGLHMLNQAYIVLIPKKAFPERVSDYMPISLVHSFAKIITKILANRLGPELQHLIANSQSAFVKRRRIHDSFMCVQQVIKTLNKNKIPALFIQFDIS